MSTATWEVALAPLRAAYRGSCAECVASQAFGSHTWFPNKQALWPVHRPSRRGRRKQDPEALSKLFSRPHPTPDFLPPPPTPSQECVTCRVGEATSLPSSSFLNKSSKVLKLYEKERGRAGLGSRTASPKSVETKRGPSSLMDTGLPSPARFNSSDAEGHDSRQAAAPRPKGYSGVCQ